MTARHGDGTDRNLIDLAREQVHPEGQAGHGPRASRAARKLTRVLDGYEFIREIHRGGQGVVYQAVQRSTGQDVAIKFLRHGAVSTPQEQARLEREVQILGQLRHPGIITIHDSGVVDALPYFVMDFIEGVPLDVYVAQQDPEMKELVSLFVQIAEAIQAAHLRGVFHRDLKPANILVDGDDSAHIVDFGLARVADSDATVMTQTGQFLGSMPWAAPEQARSDHAAVDVRTDVYALGVIFWQATTGHFPYEVTGGMSTVLRNITQADPARPDDGRLRPNADVETILRKCLAKDPTRRYQNAGELAADLRNYLDGRPIQARRDSAWYVAGKTMRRHWFVLSALAAVFLIAIASAVGFAWLYGEAEQARGEAEQRLAQLRGVPFSEVPSLHSFREDFADDDAEAPFRASVNNTTGS